MSLNSPCLTRWLVILGERCSNLPFSNIRNFLSHIAQTGTLPSPEWLRGLRNVLIQERYTASSKNISNRACFGDGLVSKECAGYRRHRQLYHPGRGWHTRAGSSISIYRTILKKIKSIFRLPKAYSLAPGFTWNWKSQRESQGGKMWVEMDNSWLSMGKIQTRTIKSAPKNSSLLLLDGRRVIGKEEFGQKGFGEGRFGKDSFGKEAIGKEAIEKDGIGRRVVGSTTF